MIRNSFFPLFFFFLSVLIFFADTVVAQKLQNRELNVFPKNFEVKHKTVFKNDKAFLVLKVPSYDYRLLLKAFDNYPGRPELLWETIYEFKDSVTEQIHQVEIETSVKNFALEIKVLNNNNKLLFNDIYYVNYSDVNTQIYLTDLEDVPLLEPYLTSGQSFKINHNKENIISFYIKYYKNYLNPAPPPSSRNSGYENLKHIDYNQLFMVTKGRELKLSEEGLFYIMVDSSDKRGVYISFFGDDYPKLGKVEDLILASRYITKNSEYEKMKKAVNMKSELDKYWLARNKNQNEAKRLIALYYNRMQYANRNFTTVKEGWKTDMGMIYTIFGSPDIVRKFQDKTLWYYSHGNGRAPVEMVFESINGQYILERSAALREPWNAEIMNWRLGRAQ